MTSMTPTETQTGNMGSASSTGGSPSPEETLTNAKERISRVADEVPAQAGKVAQDVKLQLRETTQRTLDDLRIQADDRATRAAQGLRDLSTRARALANGRTDEAGNLGDMMETLARQAGEFAQRLETGGVQGLLDDTSRFGRKRPFTFLALAVGAGFVAGRLVRTGAEVTGNDDNTAPAVSPSYGGPTTIEGPYTGGFA
jgi:ElaB/YqjD/DUF883 family membrane-anchored ribosome-binding protein